MRRFSVLVFSSCLALSLCSGFSRVSSVPSLTSLQSDVVNKKENCQTYVTYEDCVKEAYMLAGKCRGDSNDSQLTNVKKNICDEYEKKLRSLCSAHCGKASCLECFDKTEKIVESCKLFSKKINCDLNSTANECEVVHEPEPQNWVVGIIRGE